MPNKSGGVQASHTLYVAPELCTELILGEDWLKARKACLEFEPAKLILGEIEVPLGKQEKDKLIVVAKEDIQIPPRKVVSCEGRLLNMEVEGEIRRVASVKNYEDSEEGITLCESVVQVKEIIPVLIANTSNKTVKVQKGEEMGHAFPLRRIDQVRLDQRVKENPGKLREEVSLGLGDPVYYKVNLRKGKLSPRWEPYYRIVEQRGPATFFIWDQVSGKVKRAHANELKLAKVDTWEGPEPKPKRRRMRKVTMADSEEEESVAESDVSDRIRAPVILVDSGDEVRLPENPKVRVRSDDRLPPNTGEETSGSEWEMEDEIPLSRLREVWQRQEDTSERMKLPIKLRLRGARQAEPQE